MTNTFIRRILCVLMTAVLCCGCLVGFGAETESNPDEKSSVMDRETENALEVLRLLDIIPDYYDYNTSPDEQITRAEFANVIARVIKADEYTGEGIYFYDVPQTHYAYNAIYALTQMGIINGVGDNLFEPDEAIDSAAAYKIVLTVLGYNKYAEYNGGYPSGYIKTASRLKLLTGSAANTFMTRSEMFTLIYRALTTNLFEVTSISTNGTDKYEASDEQTLLTRYYDIYYETGIVQGAQMVYIGNRDLRNRDEVIIDDNTYTSDIDLSDSLGEEVEFFVRRDRNAEINHIIWAKNTGKTDVVNIDGDDVSHFDKQSFTLSYFDKKGEIRTLNLDRGITVVFNGKVAEQGLEEIFNMPHYALKLISSDKKYDTAIVKAYENYVVDIIDNHSAVVYDKEQPQRSLKMDSSLYDYMKITQAGSEVKFDNIEQNMVLSAFMSKDSRYLEVVVTDYKIDGVLDGISYDEDNIKLSVNGEKYIMPKDTVVENIPKAGDTVTLFMDCADKVAYINVASDTAFAAYFINMARTGVIDESLRFKVLNQNGTIEVHDCSDRLVLDGKKISDLSEAEKQFRTEEGEFNPQLALIKLNSKKEIAEIDTAYVRPGVEEESNSLSLNMPSAARFYKYIGVFGGVSAINSSTVIFKIPSEPEGAEDKDYYVTNNSEFSDDGTYVVESYKTKERVGYEEFLLYSYDVNADVRVDNALPVLVDSIVTMLNEDNETVEGLSGYQGAAETILAAGKNISFTNMGIKPGMLVRPMLDRNGNVSDAQIIYDPEKKGTYNTTGQFNARYGMEIGFVNDVVGDVIKFGFTDPLTVNSVIPRRSAPVLVYDASDDRHPITEGTLMDASTYRNMKDDCSTVVVIRNYSNPRLFVIYK